MLPWILLALGIVALLIFLARGMSGKDDPMEANGTTDSTTGPTTPGSGTAGAGVSGDSAAAETNPGGTAGSTSDTGTTRR
jgi:hypothetical protein